MAEPRVNRKLAAILSADVVGYSRLMADDEAATVDTIKQYRVAVGHVIERHKGRIVNAPGDNILAEFASAVEAVQAAVEIQRSIEGRNVELPEERRMHFRIGLNLGDVIEEDDGTIYGDGVNIAARMEALADEGGVCISSTIHDAVEGKLDFGFDFLGERPVKNIEKPVRVYRVQNGNPSVTNDAKPSLKLPDKPSIAVLPFDNLSGDPEQEYFADGIAEDLIAALSRFRWLFVTARNSTFAYKGSPSDVRQVGQELGVRYVLEGSVRKGGNRVRVTVQLIDAVTGNHLWADRFDRDVIDLFALQDEITEAIVASFGPELDLLERDRARRKPPKNLDAWESYQRGLSSLYLFKKDENEEAQRLLMRATELDPNFATAYAALAFAIALAVNSGFCVDRAQALKRMQRAARKAIATDEKDAFGHAALARFYTYAGEYQAAIDAIQTAVDLNPNFAYAHHVRALALISVNQAEESIEADNTAARLSPRDPMSGYYDAARAVACLLMRDYERAVDFAEKASQRPTIVGFWPYVLKSAALAHLGNLEGARRALGDARRHEPNLSREFIRDAIWWNHDQLDNLFEGLSKAGIEKAAGLAAQE
jgi:adenylate cyclase